MYWYLTFYENWDSKTKSSKNKNLQKAKGSSDKNINIYNFKVFLNLKFKLNNVTNKMLKK